MIYTKDYAKAVPRRLSAAIVVFCGVWSNFLVGGLILPHGLLILHLIDDFPEQRVQAFSISSLQLGFSLISGLFVSFLLIKFSYRQVIASGSLIACVCHVIASVTNDIVVLMVVYGVLVGVAYGMIQLPGIIVVNIRFTRWRALACGIALSGTGFGTAAFSWIYKVLLSEYGWRGTALVLGAITLNGVVIGFLTSPTFTGVNPTQARGNERTAEDTKKVNNVLNTGMSDKSLGDESTADVRMVDVVANSDTNARGSFKTDEDGIDVRRYEDNRMECDANPVGETRREQTDLVHNRLITTFSRLYRNTAISNTIKCFKDPLYLCLNGTFSIWASFPIILFILPDLIVSRGIDSTVAVTTASVYGVCNTAGRIISGLLVDWAKISGLLIYGIITLAAALTIGALIFLHHTPVYYASAIVFGIAHGSFVTLRSIIFVDVLGVNLITEGLCVVVLIQGLLITVFQVSAESVRAVTSSYSVPLSVVSLMHGLGTIIIAYVYRRFNIRRRVKQAQSDNGLYE